MMDDRRVADYFVVAGLTEQLEPVDEYCKDGYNLKWYHTKPPITDIAVVFSSLGESCPKDYEIIEETPTGKIFNRYDRPVTTYLGLCLLNLIYKLKGLLVPSQSRPTFFIMLGPIQQTCCLVPCF